MKEEEKPAPRQLTGMERRKHIRLNLMGLATITVQGSEPKEAYMGCVGRGGAGCYMQDKVEPGQLVVIDLKLIEEKGTPAEMKYAARIRWVQPTGRLFMVGLQFEKMSEERYTLLLRRLKLLKSLQL